MIEAVVFDVDGTLVDSVDFHAEAWQRAFTHFDRHFDYTAIRSQIGKGGDQLLPMFLEDGEVNSLGPGIEKYRKGLLERDYLPKIEAFPAVADLFRAVRDRSRRIALASSAKSDELEVYKKIAAIEGLCDAETSSDDAEKSKPHPDIFNAAIAKLGIDPSRAVVIGDTPYDAEAARKAGISCIGLLCGGFAAEDIRVAGAGRIYRDPAHLLDRIDEWLD